MGDAIVDHIEQTIAGGQKLFDQRYHSQDCDSITCEDLKIADLKQRNLNLVISRYNTLINELMV